jgi:hypothetical protein
MLTKLIPEIYIGIIELTLWLSLLVSGFIGYYVTVPALRSAGLILANDAASRLGGAVICVVAAFLFLVVWTGPLLLLVDIRRSVRALEANSSDNNRTEDLDERTEPVLKL